MIALKKVKNSPPVTIERGTDHVVIRPRNLLKAKAAVILDGKGASEETIIRRAEQALQGLSINFNGWMEEASRKLCIARDAVREDGAGDGRAAILYRAAHDIRGQGTTFGFPLATRVGTSLCQMLENCPTAAIHGGHLTSLVDQHVDAIRAIVREGVTKSAHPTGEALAKELEVLSEQVIAAQTASNLH